MAFALDNNRGRDGEAFQAEHFAVLHDEQQGWINVTGNGPYDNAQRELQEIPDSPAFRFRGSPASDMIISSEVNAVRLTVAPIPQHLHRTHGDAVVWTGSAAAVLDWRGRSISGRSFMNT